MNEPWLVQAGFFASLGMTSPKRATASELGSTQEVRSQNYARCDSMTATKNGSEDPPLQTCYQRARTRYFRTDVPSLATGTLNCAAKAAVFVNL